MTIKKVEAKVEKAEKKGEIKLDDKQDLLAETLELLASVDNLVLRIGGLQETVEEEPILTELPIKK